MSFPFVVAAQTINVATEAQLNTALTTAPAGATIVFTADITLTGELSSVATNMTIDGNGHTLSGSGQYRGFVIAAFAAASASNVPVTVAIQDLTIANTVATGGAGAAGGGGGAGLGGAIFVADQANVSLTVAAAGEPPRPARPRAASVVAPAPTAQAARAAAAAPGSAAPSSCRAADRSPSTA